MFDKITITSLPCDAMREAQGVPAMSKTVVYRLIDAKGRACLEHSDLALLEFWANQWCLSDYSIKAVA